MSTSTDNNASAGTSVRTVAECDALSLVNLLYVDTSSG